MRRPTEIPAPLRHRAFHRDEAISLGVTPRMLQHERFVEVFHRVYRPHDHHLSSAQWVEAARLAMPADALLSHQSRLVPLGLEYGSLFPLHFTVARDHHIALDDVFLHRTLVMPPRSDDGVSIEAAVVGLASELRLLDVIKIVDWLLHRGHLDLGVLREYVARDPWRPGVPQVKDAIPHFEPRSRSLLETEARVFMTFAGLPRPASNLNIYDGPEFVCCGDLVIPELRLVVEVEGRQHALDVQQFARDIDRYARVRGADWEYVQATAAHLGRPRAYVLNLHRVMVRRGYRGPAPVFGADWYRLLAPPLPHRPRGR